MALLLGASCCACAGGPQLPSLPGGSTTGDLPNLAVVSEPSHIPQPSAEVYTRIARGANACWFGPQGRLAASHIFHADAAPSMSGGAVEIVVHERAVDQPKPWGYKAFRIALTETAGLDGTPGGGGTRIAVENTRIADAEAARMRAEVFQWASGLEGCKSDPTLDRPATAPAPTQPSSQAAPKQARPKSPAAGGAASTSRQ